MFPEQFVPTQRLIKQAVATAQLSALLHLESIIRYLTESPFSLRQLSGACSLQLICQETKEDPTIPTIPRTTDTAAYDRAWPCQPCPISITLNNATDYYKETSVENNNTYSCCREHFCLIREIGKVPVQCQHYDYLF